MILDDPFKPSPAARFALPLLFLGYAAALFALALALPFEGQPDWSTPARGFGATISLGDPNSFLLGATDIAQRGWMTPENRWLVRVWPPGFFLLEGAVLRVVGPDGPLLVVLLVLACLACAAWMVLLRQLLAPAWPGVVATVAPLLLFLVPVVPFYLLSPIGVALGETFAFSFFAAGFLLVLHAVRRGSREVAIAAGLALAGSAYFRSQFELLVVFLTAGAIAWAAVDHWRRRKGAAVRRPELLLLAIALAAAHLAMLPWRVHNFAGTKSFGWVVTSSLVAINSLTTEQDLLKKNGSFVVRGGGHLACKLEPSYCGSTKPRHFYAAFLMNIGPWVAAKARLLPQYWTAPPRMNAISGVSVPPTWPQYAANVLLLAGLATAVLLAWRQRASAEGATRLWFLLSMGASLCVVYLLAHLEARYFYLPKVIGMVALLAALARPGPRHRFF